MTDQQPNSTSDELQQGLDTTANFAGNAIKHGLPSRSPKGISRSVGNPQAAAPSGINPPQNQANNVNQPFGSAPENIPNHSEGGHGSQEGASPQRGPSSGPSLSERPDAGFSGAGNENIQNHNPRMDIPSGEMGTADAGTGGTTGSTAGGTAAGSAGKFQTDRALGNRDPRNEG